MSKNCRVFQFKDCCFEVQKDREGAARVKILSFRSLSGKTSTFWTASPFKYLSVGPTSANINSTTSIQTSTETSPLLSANLLNNTMNPPKQKSKKQWTISKTSPETLKLTNQVKIAKTLTTLATKTKSSRETNKKKVEIHVTNAVWRADRCVTTQLRKTLSRENYH